MAAFTLRALHGVLQVAMGWEGIHLYQFCLRTVRYGETVENVGVMLLGGKDGGRTVRLRRSPV